MYSKEDLDNIFNEYAKKAVRTEKGGTLVYLEDGSSVRRESCKERHYGQMDWLYFKDADGKYHREDGPASIYRRDGYYRESWYKHGHLHREDGPAYMANDGGFLFDAYCIDGKTHREDGPAIITSCYTEHWINGEKISRDEPIVSRETTDKVRPIPEEIANVLRCPHCRMEIILHSMISIQ